MRTVTTPSGSERYVVDSSGWVEFLGNGPKAEVYKKMLREQDLALAEKFLSTAFSFQAREIVLDVSLAALAAKKGLAANLPMADAMIYATAQAHQAELITSDAHFSGLPGVTLI